MARKRRCRGHILERSFYQQKVAMEGRGTWDVHQGEAGNLEIRKSGTRHLPTARLQPGTDQQLHSGIRNGRQPSSPAHAWSLACSSPSLNDFTGQKRGSSTIGTLGSYSASQEDSTLLGSLEA